MPASINQLFNDEFGHGIDIKQHLLVMVRYFQNILCFKDIFREQCACFCKVSLYAVVKMVFTPLTEDDFTYISYMSCVLCLADTLL